MLSQLSPLKSTFLCAPWTDKHPSGQTRAAGLAATECCGLKQLLHPLCSDVGRGKPLVWQMLLPMDWTENKIFVLERVVELGPYKSVLLRGQ